MFARLLMLSIIVAATGGDDSESFICADVICGIYSTVDRIVSNREGLDLELDSVNEILLITMSRAM